MNNLRIGTTKIELVQGDITSQDVEAIVNAANSSLAGGGGVDGAIHRAGGQTIMDECRTLGGCPTGQAKITSGGNLPARFVIHAVGPVYYDGKQHEPEFLASAYRNSLAVAREHNLKSIAFPSLSSGAYRYPIQEAARIAMVTTADYLKIHPGAFEIVRFVLFSERAFCVFETRMEKLGESLSN